MEEKRSIKEILDDMRAQGGVCSQYADELEEAVNREFKEFANEVKAQIFMFIKEREEAQ